MAILYRATVVPSKMELLAAWLPAQHWAASSQLDGGGQGDVLPVAPGPQQAPTSPLTTASTTPKARWACKGQGQGGNTLTALAIRAGA